MGGTMRAAFFEAAQTMAIRETALPVPAENEVRLRVRYCGICGSDLSLYKTGVWSGPDVILGHEISAVVDQDPAGEWAPGARVVPYPTGRGCGECVWCREGRIRYCLNPPMGQHSGGFAEFVAVPRSSLIAIPDDLDERTAAVAEPLGVALRGVWLAESQPGDLAFVSGLGPIGLFAVAGLAAAGCRVVGADPREDRRAVGLEVGCDVVLDNTKDDPVAATMAIDPHGPRVALECSGVPDSLQQVFDVCGHAGAVVILGIPMAPVFLLRMTLKEQRAFSIQGPSPQSMRGALDLLRTRPQTAKVITGEVPLEDTNQAHADLVAGIGGVKVLVAPGA
jgi:threonine dehydrogenase-like Zn-dependent dehydrogenase